MAQFLRLDADARREPLKIFRAGPYTFVWGTHVSVHSLVKVHNSCLNVDPSNYRVPIHRTRIIQSMLRSLPSLAWKLLTRSSLKGVHVQLAFASWHEFIIFLVRSFGSNFIKFFLFLFLLITKQQRWFYDTNFERGFCDTVSFVRNIVIELHRTIISQKWKTLFKAASIRGFCGLDRAIRLWKVNICWQFVPFDILFFLFFFTPETVGD